MASLLLKLTPRRTRADPDAECVLFMPTLTTYDSKLRAEKGVPLMRGDRHETCRCQASSP